MEANKIINLQNKQNLILKEMHKELIKLNKGILELQEFKNKQQEEDKQKLKEFYKMLKQL